MKPVARSDDSAWKEYLDRRPIIVAVAGPNGAGKSTFVETHLSNTGLRFLNADVVAREFEINPYDSAKVVAALRTELVTQRESFIFETVFSDPVGDKLGFLKHASESGYAVILCFIGIASVHASEQRVAMRASQGGHDVPIEKLKTRFPRTQSNLAVAIHQLPCVLVFDNDDLRTPFRLAAVFINGKAAAIKRPSPRWLQTLL